MKETVEEIERELVGQSHRIVFADAPGRRCRRAVNPRCKNARNVETNNTQYETSKIHTH